MPSSSYLRPLLNALTGLIFSVSGLLILTLILLITDTPDGDVANNPTAMPGVKAATTRAPKVRPAGYEAGKTLFTNNCAPCHAVTGEVVVGPGLRGVRQRTPGDKWLQNWIRNSSVVIASGEPYAVAIYGKFNKTKLSETTATTRIPSYARPPVQPRRLLARRNTFIKKEPVNSGDRA